MDFTDDPGPELTDPGLIVDAVLRMRADHLSAGGPPAEGSALVFDTITRLRAGGFDCYSFLMLMLHCVMNRQDPAEIDALVDTLMETRSCRGVIRAAARHDAARN